MKPDDIVETLKKSSLRGRGGAGFPTGMKWGFLPKNDKPRYLCVNADEGEPGHLQGPADHGEGPAPAHRGLRRLLLRHRLPDLLHLHPRRVHEGIRVLDKALDEAYAAGYVGKNILGTGVDVDIYLHRGAGSYECGEETALIESLEGKRGQPRAEAARSPRCSGLYNCPTIVNNVETIVCVPAHPRAGRGVVRRPGHRRRTAGPSSTASAAT